MSCNTMRDLERERERDEERKRKRKKEEEAKRQKEKAERAKADRDRVIATLKAKAKKYQWTLTATGPGKFTARKPNNANDLIEFTVFTDGKLRHNTPGVISMSNHRNSDGFLDEIAETLKGKWKIVVKHFGGHAHAHGHTHTHSH